MLVRKKRMGAERVEGNGECVIRYFVRSHTFYFESTELYVGPDPYRKGSIIGN